MYISNVILTNKAKGLMQAEEEGGSGKARGRGSAFSWDEMPPPTAVPLPPIPEKR
jgi:hypothetical protein